MNPYTAAIRQIIRMGTLNPRFLQWQAHEKGNNLKRSRIPEDIRQLQSYWNVIEGKYPERQDIFLVTPDGRYDAYFEQQGFKVLHPDILPVDKATSGKLEDFEGTNHKEAVQ